MHTAWQKSWPTVLIFIGLFVASWLPGGGLVSSNDGSHLALARALALRQHTSIDPDRDLCLRVDVSRRAGHAYSDRPPGTAFVALAAVWIGHQFDATIGLWSRKTGQIALQPARKNYARTYVARLRQGPALIDLQGTALLVGLHVRFVAMVALGLLLWLMKSAGVQPWRRYLVISLLAVASLWGPYATVLFNHVTAGTALLGLWAALRRDGQTRDGQTRDGQTRAGHDQLWLPLLGGLVGGLAVAADYALLLAVVPMVLLHAPARRWHLWLAGALPIAALVALYHQAAFGSPWAVGYDFQQNFAFARDRSNTFNRSPLHGLWVLWGAGRGAGLLAQSPLWLLGLPGLLLASNRRLALALFPWILALSMHRTPWGGGTMDHRYLIPVLPFLAFGLALGWQRLADGWRVSAADPASPTSPTSPTLAVRFRASAPRLSVNLAVIVLGAWSAVGVWQHFLAWRG